LERYLAVKLCKQVQIIGAVEVLFLQMSAMSGLIACPMHCLLLLADREPLNTKDIAQQNAGLSVNLTATSKQILFLMCDGQGGDLQHFSLQMWHN